MVNCFNYYFKDIVKLIQTTPIYPIDIDNDSIIYTLLLISKIPGNFVYDLPYDILRSNVIPYIKPKFNIYKNYNKFKVVLKKDNISWVVYFDNSQYNGFNYPVYNVISSNNMYVNHNSFNIQLINIYFSLYSKWLNRITLTYIVFQYKKFMKRWINAKKHIKINRLKS